MVFEICAVIITIILVLLAVYLIQTLKAAQAALNSSRQALDKLAGEVADVKEDLHLLLQASTAAAEKIDVRINDFDPLLEALASLGRTLKGAAHAFETSQLAQEWAEKKKTGWQEGMTDLLELTSIGMKIFQHIKKRK